MGRPDVRRHQEHLSRGDTVLLNSSTETMFVFPLKVQVLAIGLHQARKREKPIV